MIVYKHRVVNEGVNPPGYLDVEEVMTKTFATFQKYIPQNWEKWTATINVDEKQATNKRGIGFEINCVDKFGKHINVPSIGNQLHGYMIDASNFISYIQEIYSKLAPINKFSKIAITYTNYHQKGIGTRCEFKYPDSVDESAITEEAASQKDGGWKYKIPLTNKALGDTEKKIGCKLPDDLKKFVIATNAATPENYNFTVGGKEKVYGATLSFDCDSDNGDTICSAIEAIGNSKVIPFGVDSFGNFICYVIKDGSIVFWDHENGKFLKVAKNLHDFISSLHQA